MSTDADEHDVFEIVDYTTASEWERFTVSLEECFHEWRIAGLKIGRSYSDSNEALIDKVWQEKMEVIKFLDFAFKITYHFQIPVYNNLEKPCETEKDEHADEENFPLFLSDMINHENDFPSKAHCLGRWYGLEEFIVLTPAISTQQIDSPSKARLLVSSMTIAANNTNCQVPLFLQIHNPAEKVYIGVGVGENVRTDFDIAHVKIAPPHCTHLSGLLDVFKNKLGCTVTSEPVMVSVRFTFLLNDWPHTLWMQVPPDLDLTLSEVGFSDLGKLPFGALSDPISELQVSTTWPCMSEHVLVDSEVYSDLNPFSAPIWTARIQLASAPPCLLSEYLGECLHVCRNKQSIVNILGHDFDPYIEDGSNIVSALDRITGSPVPSISSVLSKVVRKRATHSGHQGPIPNGILSMLLNFIFPDSDDKSSQYSETFSQIPNWVPPIRGLSNSHPLKNVLSNFKSCGCDSIVWRIAIVFCHTIHSLGGLSAAAHLYYEILLELRFRWDNCLLIPGLPEGPPDLSTCLLHQKLQMLNCCIQKRFDANHSVLCATSMTSELLEEDEASSEEFDEFYECVDTEIEDLKGRSGILDKADGRLQVFCKDVLLINGVDHLYIPVTQECAPLTEDRLEEQTEELLRLGSDDFGSNQRARMMSSALLSDMESFKAANPGSVLEDFVRWYSPRDWIEDEDEISTKEVLSSSESKNVTKKSSKGKLSARMLLSGNLWEEVWSSAKPVPARRQKRLFDDTREAEHILEWLNNISPGKFCLHFLPTVIHACLCRLSEEAVLYTLKAEKDESQFPKPRHSNSLAAQLEMVAQRGVRLARQPVDFQRSNDPRSFSIDRTRDLHWTKSPYENPRSY